jgi:lysophospholipase L1-like esterase
MDSVPLMVEAQREIARKTEIAFYNLFEAMGGENSMVSFVENDPPLANKDYTHLNSLGGRRVATIFVKSLINEFQKYNDQVKKHVSAVSTLVVSSK